MPPLAGANISGLTPELLHNIFARCDLVSIKSLRLSCHRLSAVADEYLLPALEIYYARESLELTHRICEHPRISRGVRFVCVHADRLNGQRGHTAASAPSERLNVLSYEDWRECKRPGSLSCTWSGWSMIYPGSPMRIAFHDHEDHIQSQRRVLRGGKYQRGICSESLVRCRMMVSTLKATSEQWSEAELGAAYQQYLQLWEDQAALDTDESFRDVFRALFSHCPILNDVIVTMGDSLAPTSTYRVKAFQEALAFPKSDPDALDALNHVFSSLLSEAASAGKRLGMLGAGRLTHKFFFQDQDKLDQLTPALVPLKKIILQLETPFEAQLDPYDEKELMFDELRNPANQQIPKLLAVAEGLEELVFIGTGRSETGKMPLRAVFGNDTTRCRWPRLSRLRIDWVETSGDYLFDFLMAHKATLTHLQLYDVHLSGGNWTDLFQMLAGQLPALQEIRLRGWLSSRDGTKGQYAFRGSPLGPLVILPGEFKLRLEQYILHGGSLELPPGKLPSLVTEADIIADELEPYLYTWLEEKRDDP